MTRLNLILATFLLAPAIHSTALAVVPPTTVRFATYNIAMGLESQGEMLKRLQSGDDEGLRKVAAVIQQVRPDVLLLNEFDYLPGKDAGKLFVKNYLQHSQYGRSAINYFAYTFDGPVNTGVDSGLDLDNNGKTSDPADAWGFGRFPGQYGMQVLSRYPLNFKPVRTFQHFLWKDMPGASFPVNPDGSPWYPEQVQQQLRLSSKSHWDISVATEGQLIHFLVSHPTPPVFDGLENRNGLRNHDEIRLWADYIDPQRSGYIYDDEGTFGGLPKGVSFVIAGDQNADPVDGASDLNAIGQLLDHPLVSSKCKPVSDGAPEASEMQAGKNLEHKGNPGTDTGDFNDQYVGNMRVDYVLPSVTLAGGKCGVYWPTKIKREHEWIGASDHRLVWADVEVWHDSHEPALHPHLN